MPRKLRLSYVAAVAPAANIAKILAVNPAVDKQLGPYIALSYSRFYADITFEQTLPPQALIASREIVNLCGFFPPEDPQAAASAVLLTLWNWAWVPTLFFA
jgi:hypothetical protein